MDYIYIAETFSGTHYSLYSLSKNLKKNLSPPPPTSPMLCLLENIGLHLIDLIWELY